MHTTGIKRWKCSLVCTPCILGWAFQLWPWYVTAYHFLLSRRLYRTPTFSCALPLACLVDLPVSLFFICLLFFFSFLSFLFFYFRFFLSFIFFSFLFFSFRFFLSFLFFSFIFSLQFFGQFVVGFLMFFFPTASALWRQAYLPLHGFMGTFLYVGLCGTVSTWTYVCPIHDFSSRACDDWRAQQRTETEWY